MDSGSGGCLNSRVQLSAKVAALEQIVRWRDLYRAEMNCQIIHDSIHSRPGWTVEYILRAGDKPAGYGSIAVAGPWKKNRSIYEFFVLPQFRSQLFDLFAELVRASGVSRIETQSNDVLLTSMLHALAPSTKSESILYYDKLTTTFAPADATFRVATVADQPDVPVEQLPSHGVVEYKGRVAGKGGILFHYNRPYGDIYMEVGKEFRRRGLGSFLVQELKRVCYEQGSVPAARCSPKNIASRSTLQKAGFVPCGHILIGSIAKGRPG